MSLAFGTEVVIPVKMGIKSYRVAHHDPVQNDEKLLANLDLLEKKREQAHIRELAYKQSMVKSYNKRVKSRTLQPRDLVLRKVNLMIKIARNGKLGAKWEGPYIVSSVTKLGTYYIKNSDREELSRPWNIIHLKRYYP